MCFSPPMTALSSSDRWANYSPLVRQFGEDGLVVEIAPNSPHHINPMDLDVSMDDEVSPISLKCDFILSLMELIVGGKDAYSLWSAPSLTAVPHGVPGLSQ